MRHHNANRKFGREKGQRAALMKALATSLILREKITTTEAKAKELRPFVEKLITKGKTDSVQSRRLISSTLSPKTTNRLVEVISPKYKDRNGGYTRITKLKPRMSDGSPMAQIEFV